MDRRISSNKSRTSSSKTAGLSCVICFKTQTIFSIGPCDHPVCYECSTTMRVLCDQKECPICRRIMTKVIFTKEVSLFKDLDGRQYSRYNKKYGIAFEDHSAELHFDQLLRCYCKKCYDRPDFGAFEQLAAHMERSHRLYACRLCVKHLKIFPSHRRWYNYDELGKHEECGDPDNTSHRGHPQCQFCNIRYLDKDELYKHLRKEHFYCHFCDADGIQDYYMTYEWLRRHYHDKHYLCEEGNCINEQYTSVFRSSIDLQAHKAQTHSRELGKHGSKEARTLRLEFHLRPRHNPIVEAGRPNQYQPPHNYANDIYAPERPINVRDTSDFPSLNGQNTSVLPCARTRKQNQNVNTRDLHSFPALSQESGLPLKPQSTSNNIRMATVLKKPPEPPKPDRKKDTAAGPRMPNQARDFPSLDGNQQQLKTKEALAVTSSGNNSSGGSWVSKAKTANENAQDEKKKAKKEPAIKKKVAEAPKLPGASDFPNLNKKLEPNKSNLAKLGNKKKPDNPKKNSAPAVQEIQSNNESAKKSGGSQTTTVAENNSNNHSKKSAAIDGSSKLIDHSKENSRPKTKSAEAQQCNGRSDMTTTKAAVASKTDPNNSKIVPSEPMRKESSFKKKESPPRVNKLEEVATSDNNSQKDKKKRKKNENNKEPPLGSVALLPPKNFSKTPKIPPGFENTVNQHVVRAPPGLTSSSSRRQQQQHLKTPPGLSLTTGHNNHNNINNELATGIKPLYEYVHPVGSSIRNKVLINNLVAALIPARDERFDTFEKFKEMSTLFRKHSITAYDFYSYCVEALCPHSFEAVFLELVLLLPDIQKQQELLHIYNRNSREDMPVEVCKYCQQVLRANDMEPHMSVHDNGCS